MVAVEEGRSNGSFSTSRKFGEVIDEFMSSGPQIDRNDFQSILKGLLLFYLFGGLYIIEASLILACHAYSSKRSGRTPLKPCRFKGTEANPFGETFMAYSRCITDLILRWSHQSTKSMRLLGTSFLRWVFTGSLDLQGCLLRFFAE